MANTTIVYFDGIWDYDKTTRILLRAVAPKRDTFWVSSFENGIATIDPMCGSMITDVAEVVAGCFAEGSNFASELRSYCPNLKVFDCDENTAFTGIKFEFNEVTVMVTKENADKDKIYAEWKAGMKANAEKYRLEREAYMKTPEYRAERAKALKIANRRETVEKDVLAVDKSTELQFKDEEAAKIWEHWVEINSKDSYSNCVVTYARRWAKYMQHLMEKHNKTVAEIAGKASHASDIEGITGFMYGCAVDILAQCWKHGEELRKWHNKKWGQEDTDGVVNPAVLTVNVG